jgi:penicillin-binding protein 1C
VNLLARFRSLLRTRGGRRAAVALALAPLAALAAVALGRSGLEAPEPTLLVRDRSGRFLGELPAPGDERLGFWPLATIPERVAAATIAIEDRRFDAHWGVDPLAIARAVRDNWRGGRPRSGASTLAMQVARMQAPGERGYLRKAVEAATAVAMTLRHGRRAVLAHYLTIVPYGNRIHGIGYAARRYFDKPVEDLSWAEVAFLAAIPQAPAKSNPYDPAGQVRAIARGKAILRRLAARGELSRVELASALEELARIRIPYRATRPEAALHALLALARDPAPGTRRSAANSLRTDGPARPRRGPSLQDHRRRGRSLLITTTLDLDLQHELAWLAARAVEEAADRGAGNAAILVVERGSWEVRAAVSSTGYFDERRAGAIDYLRLPRSAGSTLKPFLFAAALERGAISTTTILDDLGPGPGGIVNSDDRFLGPLLPRAALANSRNVPAAALLARVGVDPVYALFGDLGLHAHVESARRYGLGLALGSLPVTLERLVGAYTTLAGDGRLRTLRWTAGGPDDEPAAPRLVSEATARLVTQFLADPQARLPTFPRLGATEPPFPLAVKTGTSSRYRDAWTIGWSDRHLVGVWIGHPDQRPMARLSGYRIAARLAREVFERLERSAPEFAARGFPPPAGYAALRVCPLTGAHATAACDRVALEWVAERDLPLPPCAAHALVAVERATGRLAAAATPAAEIAARSFVDLPARYAGWAERAGLPSLARALAASDAARRAESRALAHGRAPAIEIVAPEPGLRLLFDPEAPTERNTLALRAEVEPAVPQLVWYVDGVPFATAERPYTARWRLARGAHTIEARVPFSPARSRRIEIVVD